MLGSEPLAPSKKIPSRAPRGMIMIPLQVREMNSVLEQLPLLVRGGVVGHIGLGNKKSP